MENLRFAQRPEHKILFCCARDKLDSVRAARLLELLDQPLDWVYLAAKALPHRVTCMLYWNLQAAAPELVPPEWMQYLRKYFQDNALRNLVLTQDLLKIVEELRVEGVSVVPYKGAVLASLAYGNLALREFMDLDFICPSGDIPRAYKVMIGLGYKPTVDIRKASEKLSIGVPGQYPFVGKDGRLVELHSERTLRYFPVTLNLEDLMAHLQPVPLGGQEVMSFSAEDLLPMLCVHASKHFWDRLSWICDIAELTRHPQGLDWQRIFAQARLLGAERVVHLGLLLANTILDTQLPEEVLGRVRSDRVAQKLSLRISEGLLTKPHGQVNLGERFLYRVQTQKTLLGGLRHVARVTLTPAEEDWEVLRLPTLLASLYPVLRLWRLTHSHGLGIRKPSAPDLAPYVPCTAAIVDRLLGLAELSPGDVLYDLGCGDGRIVVAAAKRFGIRTIGVEMDPERAELARSAALREGVAHLVGILQQDAKTVNIGEATVVTMYLTLAGNFLLREKLLTELRPGTRIVSRDFVMPAWHLEKVEHFADPNPTETIHTSLYLYRVPDKHAAASKSLDARQTPGLLHDAATSTKPHDEIA